MNFVKEEGSMDLGDTVLDNIFLREYMPQADGNFVKVYLLAYGYAMHKEENKNHGSIAKTLGILESDVHRAWDYWEDQGIIRKVWPGEDQEGPDYRVEFINLKELYIKNVYQTSTSNTKFASLTSPLSDPLIADLLAKGDYFFRRPLSYQEKRDLASWVVDYNMPPQMIEEAIRYTTEVQNKYSIRYLERVVQNWASDGIRSPEALEENQGKYNKDYYRYRKVMAAMGLKNKPLSDQDLKEVNSWFKDLGFSMEMVLEACSRSINTNNPSVAYIRGVLRSWYNKGIFTLEDIEKKDLKPREKVVSSQRPKTGNKFHNFSQSSSDFSPEDLEKMAKKRSQNYGKLKDEP